MNEHDPSAPVGRPGRERPGAGDAIPSAAGAGLPGADAGRSDAAGKPTEASSEQDLGPRAAPAEDPTRVEGPGDGPGRIGADEPVEEPIAGGGGATVVGGAGSSAEPTGATAADTGIDEGTSDEPTRVDASSGEGPGAPTGPGDETTRVDGPGEARGTPAPGSEIGGPTVGGPEVRGSASGSAGPTAATAAAAGGGWVPPPPPGPPGPGGPAGPHLPYPPAAPRRRLTRSRERRVLAGVAGGLGEYTGIDPVLFRVLFAVLTVFGGAGILLYVIGWLFLPEQDQPSSPAEALIGRGRGSDAVQAILLAIVALVVAGVLVSGDGRDVVLLALVVVGAVLLARHLDETRDRPAAPVPAPAPPAVPPPAPGPYEPYQAYPPYPPYPPYQVPPPGLSPVDPYAPAMTTVTSTPETTGQKRESSLLGRLTLSLLLLVLGVTAALDAAGAVEPQARHYLALAVGVIGLGLLVGAWRGRARGLIWLGLPLTIALVAVGASQVRLSGGAGDRQYGPLSVAEIQDRYEVSVGNLELDLSDVDFAGESVSTTAAAGVGHVAVTVPRNVDVDVLGRAGIGEADLFGEKANGTSPERTVVDEGPDGEGGGHLRLVLDVGVGKVEVDRETA